MSSKASLRVETFGGPVAFQGKHRVHLRPLALATAALLAGCGRKGLATEELIERLWDAVADRRFRRRLSQTLYEVRRAFGGMPVTTRDGDRYCLNYSVIETDVDVFHNAIAVNDLRRAVALVRKGFLSQLERSPSQKYATWVQAEANELHCVLLSCLQAGWENEIAQQNWPQAVRLAKYLHELCPLDEKYLQRVLDGYRVLGDYENMRAHFYEYVARRRSMEPSWRPLKTTTAILKQVKEGCAQNPIAPKPYIGSLYLRIPFIGRQEDLTRLQSLVANPSQDTCRCVVVTGPAGVGKSRLVRHLLASWATGDQVALSAQEGDRSPCAAFGALSTLLDHPRVRQVLCRLEQPWRGDIERVLDDVHGFSLKSLVTPSTAPAYLALAVLQLLRQLTQEAKHVIIFIDESDCADWQSVAVISQVCERWRMGKITLVFTRRALDGDSRWKGFCSETAGGIHIPLGRLPDHEMDALQRAVKKSVPGPWDPEMEELWEAMVPILLGAAEGIPGKGLGLLHPLVDFVAVGPRELRAKETQESVWRVLRRITAALNAPKRMVLAYCAFAARPTGLAQLAEVTGTAEAVVAAEVDALVKQRLLSLSADGIELAHPMLTELLRSTVGPGTRILLHSRIAEELADSEQTASQLEAATHFMRAGQIERATLVLLRVNFNAGDIERIERGIQLLQAIISSESSLAYRKEALLRLGELLSLTGMHSQAEVALKEAAAIARTACDREVELRAAAVLVKVRAAEDPSASANCLRDVLRLKEAVIDAGRSGLLPQVVELELRLRAGRGEHLAVRKILDELPRLEALVGPPDAALLESLRSLGSIYGDPKKAEAIAQRVLATAQQAGDADLSLRALNWLLIIQIQRGSLNRPEGRLLRERASDAASSATSFLERAKLAANMGVWYLDTGDLDAAEMSLNNASTLLGRLPTPEARPNILVNRGEIALERGLYTHALGFFKRARSLCPGNAAEPLRQHATAGVCMALVHLGKLRDAKQESETLMSGSAWQPFDTSLLVRAHTRLLQVQGKRSAAVECLIRGQRQLKGRFDLGWARLGLEVLRLDSRGNVCPEELHEFFRKNNLKHLMSRLSFIGFSPITCTSGSSRLRATEIDGRDQGLRGVEL